MTNIIADIAGNYKTLLALLGQMPDGEIIGLGDLIDRGPRSKEVVDFFMDPANNARCVLGNHEHMMLETCRDTGHYSGFDWVYNGGDATIKAYETDGVSVDYLNAMLHYDLIPASVLNWVASLPLYIEIGDTLLSHSFMYYDTLEQCCNLDVSAFDSNFTIIWNREEPTRSEKHKLQIAGHNSQFGEKRFEDGQGLFALCLDDCRIGKQLTGLHLETMEVFKQDYID